MARERVLIILNPVAGRKAAQKALFPLVKRLCAQDSTVIVHTTRAHGEAAEVAREAGAECDRIIVLDEGRAVGVGTHGQLLETCEVYKEIYASQFKRKEEEQ